MQYTCDYKDIEKGICYFLTTHPDERFRPSEILNGLIKENICPELNSLVSTFEFELEFDSKCLNSSKIFSKIKHSGSCYLFSTKNLIDLEQLKTSAMSPQDYTLSFFTTIYEEGETILHILCKNALYKHIENISKFHNIDPHLKNDYYQSLFEVIPLSHDGNKTFQVLLNIFLTQSEKQLQSKLELINELNLKFEKCNEQNKFLKQQVKNLSESNDKFITQNNQLICQYENQLITNDKLKSLVLFQSLIIVFLFLLFCNNKQLSYFE